MELIVLPFPPGVAAVPKAIEGTAFFPGGLGLWMEEPVRTRGFPTGQVQGSRTGLQYDCDLRTSTTGTIGSRTQPDVASVEGAADRIGIPPESCFFTNAYMGLRAGGRETGRFCGARDHGFVERCAMFFGRQLAVVHPKLILLLGMEPFRMLGPRLFGIQVPSTLKACDQFYPCVRLERGEAAIVIVTHPSLYCANVVRRRYLSFVGADAEAAMVRDAIAAIGMQPVN